MKKLKLFLFLTFAVLVSEINAQTESGKLLFGGASNIGFSTSKTKISANGKSEDYSKTTTLNFSPQIGYFVFDGLAIGTEFPMQIQKEKILILGDDATLSSFSYAIAPFVRYYFGENNIKPFIHGGIGVGGVNIKSESDNGTEEDTYKMTTFNIGGGLGIFVTENVSFDLGIFYSSITQKQDQFLGLDAELKEITSGLNLSVGIVVTF